MSQEKTNGASGLPDTSRAKRRSLTSLAVVALPPVVLVGETLYVLATRGSVPWYRWPILALLAVIVVVAVVRWRRG